MFALHGIIQSISKTALLLDTYTGAAAAYSLRKLRTAYSGSAIRVRRSSDNTEQDIGFTSAGVLDETALTTFVGSGNGFVTTWYDQSGNAGNLTLSTAAKQPTIVSSGVVSLSRSKPAIYATQTSPAVLAASVSIASPFTIIQVCHMTTDKNGYRVALGLGLQGFQWGYDNLGKIYMGSSNFINATRTKPTNSEMLFGISNGASSSINMNGSQISTGTINSSSTSTISLSSNGGATDAFIGYHQELIIYTSDQSANRTAIESNINSFYGIY